MKGASDGRGGVSGIVIRQALSADVPAMAKIGVASFRGYGGDQEAAEGWLGARARESFDHQSSILSDGEKVIGYACLGESGGPCRPEPVVEVIQFALAPESRGRGLTKDFWDEAVGRMKAWVLAINLQRKRRIIWMRVFAWVYVHNTRMRRMLQHCLGQKPELAGWRNLYGEPEVMYLWRLRVAPARRWPP